MIILGLNVFNPDAAVALLVDGAVVAAVEEERLARVSHAGGFPAARRQQLLVIFARARKTGEDPLGGVSTRRLSSFRVDLNR